MKKSDLWFKERAIQDTRTNVANLAVLQKVGPNNFSEPTRGRNTNNQKYFIVGKSEVGGEEVV